MELRRNCPRCGQFSFPVYGTFDMSAHPPRVRIHPAHGHNDTPTDEQKFFEMFLTKDATADTFFPPMSPAKMVDIGAPVSLVESVTPKALDRERRCVGCGSPTRREFVGFNVSNNRPLVRMRCQSSNYDDPMFAGLFPAEDDGCELVLARGKDDDGPFFDLVRKPRIAGAAAVTKVGGKAIGSMSRADMETEAAERGIEVKAGWSDAILRQKLKESEKVTA